MLDNKTRKRIDDLRDILLGKTPSPQSQVEQITTGLIYKFMNDMDKEAKEMGGVPSFFVGEFEKYSWDKLLDSKLTGKKRVELYSEAIEKMYTNSNAPQLFREIFKNSYLPFKDPDILNMFLKGISEFSYSDSEILGDAYEYLVSFLGSQGDTGQFRTPRHIINFLVEIINPQKNEKILDPACGTAGFLISSYKHILKNNNEGNDKGILNAYERKLMCENLVGYDLDPTFVKISLVNLHLHKFTNPKIEEYDTLSSEKKWNEFYNVILANPPFMTPKGGIKPHSKFSIKSKKAEVLFVDYIVEHLLPGGRAGIIVPEGIIFHPGSAYKKLRKKLIEDSLIGVISLPRGVFKPYSDVKTSILILDKKINPLQEKIFFASIKNDGFSLGDQRKPIDKNDLPKIIWDFRNFIESKDHDGIMLSKNLIIKDRSISLNVGRYTLKKKENSEFPFTKLGDLITLEYGKPLKKEDRSGSGFPVFGSNGIVGFHEKFITEGPCIIVGRKGSAGIVKFSESSAYPIDTTFYVKLRSDEVLLKFIYYALKKLPLRTLNIQSGVPGLNRNDAYDLTIPLPSIDIQREIISELDSYQKIIDGCNQIVENFRPIIDIDPSWEVSELGDIAKLKYGLSESAKDEGSYRFIRITDINQFGLLSESDKKYVSIGKDQEEFILSKGDLLMARTGATFGKCLYFEDDNPSVFAGYLIRITLEKNIIPKYFWIFSQSNYFEQQRKQLVVGGGQPQFNANTLSKVLVPIPPIDIQEKLIKEFIYQQKIVEDNKRLLDLFEKKMQEKINKVWI